MLKGPGGMHAWQMFDFRLFEVFCLLISLQVAQNLCLVVGFNICDWIVEN